ncbi:MAG TPA: fumarate hydratase, partial [Usitatibacter sp.]|nr:fumarate hydratase [Usitatibacter sp.]
MKVDPQQVEEVARELYIRALKILPPDVKEGFARLAGSETDGTARQVLDTMIRNIRIAEETENMLCQDTGIPIYKVTIGRGVSVEGADLQRA